MGTSTGVEVLFHQTGVEALDHSGLELRLELQVLIDDQNAGKVETEWRQSSDVLQGGLINIQNVISGFDSGVFVAIKKLNLEKIRTVRIKSNHHVLTRVSPKAGRKFGP